MFRDNNVATAGPFKTRLFTRQDYCKYRSDKIKHCMCYSEHTAVGTPVAWPVGMRGSVRLEDREQHQQNLASIARRGKALQGLAKIYLFRFDKI